VNIELTEEAAEYGRTALRALESAGGDELVQRTELEPDKREAIVAPVLAELGAWELDPRASVDELEAAATLCRSAGYWSVAYPVAERLARPVDVEAHGLIVIGDVPSGAVAGLKGAWVTVDLDGARCRAATRPSTELPRKSAFVTGLDLAALDHGGAADVAL